MPHIEDCILKAMGSHFGQGDSFRIRHEYMENGNVCTPPEKDPAMVVTKVNNGWVFICHRCHQEGFVADSRTSPNETKERIKAMRTVKVLDSVKEVTLPSDMVCLPESSVFGAEAFNSETNNQQSTCRIPWGAFHFLWQYGITGKTIPLYHIGWSPSWKRLIFPLFEYGHFGEHLTYDLVGWTGRDVDYKKENKYPKWLTRTKRGQRRFFMAPGKTDIVVLVEDCVSAIKVAYATGFTTIALLTTSISDDLMRWLRNKKVFLWLDGDMLAMSVKLVSRMRDLGLDAKRIHTTKDPKTYNTLFILDCLDPLDEVANEPDYAG